MSNALCSAKLAGQSVKLFSKRAKGDHFEAAALDYLQRRGLKLVERNFNVRCGEIDLILTHGSTLVFVEVRYRKSQNFGHAAETVNPAKMRKLIKTANLWLMKHNHSVHETDFRFDLVAIHNDGRDIEWIQNAITQG